MNVTEFSANEKALTKPPAAIRNLLTDTGHRNEFGKPNFRLVRAEERKVASSGVFVDWPKNYNLKERNLGNGGKVIRRSVDTRLVPRYGPFAGWALEKWVPAKAYGTKQKWYSSSVVGGTMVYVKHNGTWAYVPSQGAYPAQGDYEYTGFIFQNHELSIDTILPCIQLIKKGLEEMPTNPQSRVIRAANRMRLEAEMSEKIADEQSDIIISNAQPAFYGKPMTGYGKKRPHSSEALARKLGLVG